MDPSSSQTQHLKQDILEAQVALDQGDLRTVRSKLRHLTDPSIQVPEELRSDVTRLQQCVKADPAAKVLLAACAVFFVIVLFQYVL